MAERTRHSVGLVKDAYQKGASGHQRRRFSPGVPSGEAKARVAIATQSPGCPEPVVAAAEFTARVRWFPPAHPEQA